MEYVMQPAGGRPGFHNHNFCTIFEIPALCTLSLELKKRTWAASKKHWKGM